jgi:hypothetical protein
VSGRVQRRQARRWGQQEEAQEPPEQEQEEAAAPAPAPAAPAVDPIQQLKDLADLKSQGILTDEEFAAQKAKVLAA